MFSSIMIGIGIIYGMLLIIGAYKDHKYIQSKQREQEERRIQQNREWNEQFNQLSPSIRAVIRMIPEDQRDRAYVVALLIHNNNLRLGKEKVDWKKDGF